MPRTTLTPVAAGGAYNHAGVAVTMTAADVANMNQFVASGADLLLIHNSGASQYTFTITSVADSFGRTKDIAAETIDAGIYKVVGPLQILGWQQSDGKIYLAASNAAVKFGIIRL